MATLKSCALFVLLGVIVSVEAVWLPEGLRPECTNCYLIPDNKCGTPPGGSYFIRHFEPITEKGLTHVASSHMDIKHEYENVYKGEGQMTVFKDGSKKNYGVQIVGMFDYSSCVMHGSFFRLRDRWQDVYTWKYDQNGMSMEGPYVAAANSKLEYNRDSYSIAVFLGTKSSSTEGRISQF